MGRLFWKIFLAFWLTLIVAVVGTWTAISLQRRAELGSERELAIGPPQRLVTEMAEATLRSGGVEALTRWMSDASMIRTVPLFAVNGAGADLLGRAVPEAALARARELSESNPEAPAVRLVTAPSGEEYLLFVPGGAGPPRPLVPPPSPWLPVLIGALASVAVSAMLAWYLTRPIRNLRWAFNAAASGRLDTRVAPRMGRRRDEIADLGRDFDRMADKLQSLISAQKRLLHDISHELRSPLARVQAAIGLLQMGALHKNPEKLEASLDRIEKETVRLDVMIGEVLTLARLESGSLELGTQRVDIADLAGGIAEDAKFEAEVGKKNLEFQCQMEGWVRGRADLLHRAVENIVRNAVKYTPEGTSVDISLRRDAGEICITVSDAGPGIATEDVEHVFEPFYRGRSRHNADGFGLGLAIAHRAITAHGGTITLVNLSGGGLKVEIRLPSA